MSHLRGIGYFTGVALLLASSCMTSVSLAASNAGPQMTGEVGYKRKALCYKYCPCGTPESQHTFEQSGAVPGQEKSQHTFEQLEATGLSQGDDIDLLSVPGHEKIVMRYENQVPLQPHQSLTSPSLSAPANCRCSATFCDCANLQLTKVPVIPSSNVITGLDLHNNFIAHLPNCSFCSYSQLNYLDMSKNKLDSLHKGSFEKLGSLEYLNLQSNNLTFTNGTFPEGVFGDLRSLKVLKLNNNTRSPYDLGYDYPDEALAELTSLQVLYMDGLNRQAFGPGFAQMTSLRSLNLSGYAEGSCTLVALRNDTFQHLGQLTQLDLSTCRIHGWRVEPGAFLPLQNLQVLDVSYNFKLGFYEFMRAMFEVRKANLVSLKMNSIVSIYSLAITVNNSMVESLPRSLQYLEAKGNSFETIEPGLLQLVPENLSYLDLGGNRLVYGLYLNDLSLLKNLEILRLKGVNMLLKLPTFGPYLSEPHLTSSREQDGASDLKAGPEPLVIHLPPRLRTVDMSVSGLNYILSRLVMNPENSLKTLFLNANHFPVMLGPFIGFEKLEVLDLSLTSARTLKKEFFKHFTSLRRLMLSQNDLGEFFARSKPNSQIFSDLRNLTALDLSKNLINSFPDDLLAGLTQLATLNMEINEMWNFDLQISHMENLSLLNLSHSQLSHLPNHVITHINSLVEGRVNITVDLSSNPVKCDCNNLDFIQWMVDSPAFDPKFTNYMCQYPDSSYKRIVDSYAETLHNLHRICALNFPVFIAAIGATFFMLSFVVGAIIYRFRWKLRYMYYAAYLKLRDRDACDDSRKFKYDVFISYSSLDEKFIRLHLSPELSRRSLTLHVHGRDFAVGEYIASNIVTAINESRKTLVVLTQNLLTSKWCNYELQMANMESVSTGRRVLAFLLMESIPNGELGTDLLYHIRTNTYTAYPSRGEEGGAADGAPEVFWDKLASDLRR